MPDISSSIIASPQLIGGQDQAGNTKAIAVAGSGGDALKTFSPDVSDSLSEAVIELKKMVLHLTSISGEEITSSDIE